MTVMRKPFEVLLTVLVGQAIVGYAQYFTGVPALLVGIHLAGATAVWIAVWWVALCAHATFAVAEVRSARVTHAPVKA